MAGLSLVPLSFFSWEKYPEGPRPNQEELLRMTADHPNIIAEDAPGGGKTAAGVAFLKAGMAQGPCVYLTPRIHGIRGVLREVDGEANVVMGREHYPCPWYQETREDMPHATARDAPNAACNICPHRVRTIAELPDNPCPYYLAVAKATEGNKIVVATTAWFLLMRVFQGWPGGQSGKVGAIGRLVIDEADQLAQDCRMIMRYDITPAHVQKIIKTLQTANSRAGTTYLNPLEQSLQSFHDQMVRVLNLKPLNERTLLTEREVAELQACLEGVPFEEVNRLVESAIRSGAIDPIADREELQALEQIARTVRRYAHSLSYAREQQGRNPLNYLCVYSNPDEAKQVLTVHSQLVAGLIQHRVLANVGRCLAYSGIIGNPTHFGYETGLDARAGFVFKAMNPSFERKGMIFLPSDVPNLDWRASSTDEERKARNRQALLMALEGAMEFQKAGLRSLILVQAEQERTRILELAKEYFPVLKILTYGGEENIIASGAAERFRQGSGSVLIGTAAQYARGLDFPNPILHAIFFLRLGRPSNKDPQAQFEKSKHPGIAIAVSRWRAYTEMAQALSRNRRGEGDVSVAFLLSSSIEPKFPAWMQGTYQEPRKPFAECVRKGIALFQGEESEE